MDTAYDIGEKVHVCRRNEETELSFLQRVSDKLMGKEFFVFEQTYILMCIQNRLETPT